MKHKLLLKTTNNPAIFEPRKMDASFLGISSSYFRLLAARDIQNSQLFFFVLANDIKYNFWICIFFTVLGRFHYSQNKI